VLIPTQLKPKPGVKKFWKLYVTSGIFLVSAANLKIAQFSEKIAIFFYNSSVFGTPK
jgi:hypothetical protein